MLVRTKWRGNSLAPGAVVDVPPEVAERWVARRIAAPATEAPPDEPTGLAEDFPGLPALRAAGYATRADLAGMTHEQLVALKGVGDATARRILAELED